MVFIQTLNKFCIATKNTKDIQFINSIRKFKLVKKHNENVFTNTLVFIFIFKAMDINHQSCPPFYKFSNDLNKTTCLQCTKEDLLVELCVN
jgi:hypothetical protein